MKEETSVEKERENKNKFWKGVLVGALVTAFSGLIIVGVATGISLIGRTVIDNQVQTRVVGSSQEVEAQPAKLDMDQVKGKVNLLEDIISKRFLYETEIGRAHV